MSSSRVAVISVHTSPLDRPGGSKAGGLNVYVLELSKGLASLGWDVDIFSRATSARTPEVTEIAPGVRAIHLRAGPARPLSPEATYRHIESFERAVIDFNRTYNPPCVFTAFSTCAFPPPENRLPFAITAGERRLQ